MNFIVGYSIMKDTVSTPDIHVLRKGKVIPLQARCGPEGG